MIYAVGDIHGQATMLNAMLTRLESLPLADEDTLVFVGDYIDRGEDTRGVLELLLDLRERHPNVVFLRGNHEQMLLDARDSSPSELDADGDSLVLSDAMQRWIQYGGVETLISYNKQYDNDYLLHWRNFIPKTHWQFIEATQMEYITQHYHFVHAGLYETQENGHTTFKPSVWVREPFLSSPSDFHGRRVIFGHVRQRSGQPLIQPNKIGLDTGAYNGGPLTAIILDPNFDENGRLPEPHFLQIEPVSS